MTFLAGIAEEVFGSQQDGKAPDSKQEVEKNPLGVTSSQTIC